MAVTAFNESFLGKIKNPVTSKAVPIICQKQNTCHFFFPWISLKDSLVVGNNSLSVKVQNS